MKCPFCGHLSDKVVDSRESREGDAIRRRRELRHRERGAAEPVPGRGLDRVIGQAELLLDS